MISGNLDLTTKKEGGNGPKEDNKRETTIDD